MKKWRVGIIGVGGIFNGAHREHYLKDDRLEVVALCDIIEERAVECRDGFFPDAKVYTDFNELLKDETIDSVDICTPNYLHSIIAVAAFKAGKHVFCEKPDAVNVEEVMKMNDAAKAAGKTLMVMRNNRFTDASKLAKKFIDDGKMGEIYCGRCGWQRRRGIPGKGGWFTTKAQSGGGPLIDLGVHMIDLAIWLMGNPTPVAVTGSTYCKFADNDVSDSVNSDFGDKVEDVKVSSRLKSSAVCLVADEAGPSLAMEQAFSQMKNPMFKAKRILEINPHHELFSRLKEIHETGKDSQEFKDYCDMLYTQALLIEGILPENPVDFANKVAKLMAK